MRREPGPHAQLRLHLLRTRIQRAEKRHLDLVVRELRDDDVRIERELGEKPSQKRWIRKLDPHGTAPFGDLTKETTAAPVRLSLPSGTSRSGRAPSPWRASLRRRHPRPPAR